MLARLEQVEGIAGVRVDATGRLFALDVAPGVDEARALAGVEAVLRKAARRLSPDEAAAQLSRVERGDRWLRRADLPGLCYLEARMLAARAEGQVAAAARLRPRERDAVGEALRVELFDLMERVLAEGGRESSSWLSGEWPGVAARAAARAGDAIAPEKRDGVAAALAALHAR